MPPAFESRAGRIGLLGVEAQAKVQLLREVSTRLSGAHVVDAARISISYIPPQQGGKPAPLKRSSSEQTPPAGDPAAQGFRFSPAKGHSAKRPPAGNTGAPDPRENASEESLLSVEDPACHGQGKRELNQTQTSALSTTRESLSNGEDPVVVPPILIEQSNFLQDTLGSSSYDLHPSDVSEPSAVQRLAIPSDTDWAKALQEVMSGLGRFIDQVLDEAVVSFEDQLLTVFTEHDRRMQALEEETKLILKHQWTGLAAPPGQPASILANIIAPPPRRAAPKQHPAPPPSKTAAAPAAVSNPSDTEPPPLAGSAAAGPPAAVGKAHATPLDATPPPQAPDSVPALPSSSKPGQPAAANARPCAPSSAPTLPISSKPDQPATHPHPETNPRPKNPAAAARAAPRVQQEAPPPAGGPVAVVKGADDGGGDGGEKKQRPAAAAPPAKRGVAVGVKAGPGGFGGRAGGGLAALALEKVASAAAAAADEDGVFAVYLQCLVESVAAAVDVEKCYLYLADPCLPAQTLRCVAAAPAAGANGGIEGSFDVAVSSSCVTTSVYHTGLAINTAAVSAEPGLGLALKQTADNPGQSNPRSLHKKPGKQAIASSGAKQVLAVPVPAPAGWTGAGGGQGQGQGQGSQRKASFREQGDGEGVGRERQQQQQQASGECLRARGRLVAGVLQVQGKKAGFTQRDEEVAAHAALLVSASLHRYPYAAFFAKPDAATRRKLPALHGKRPGQTPADDQQQQQLQLQLLQPQSAPLPPGDKAPSLRSKVLASALQQGSGGPGGKSGKQAGFGAGGPLDLVGKVLQCAHSDGWGGMQLISRIAAGRDGSGQPAKAQVSHDADLKECATYISNLEHMWKNCLDAKCTLQGQLSRCRAEASDKDALLISMELTIKEMSKQFAKAKTDLSRAEAASPASEGPMPDPVPTAARDSRKQPPQAQPHPQPPPPAAAQQHPPRRKSELRRSSSALPCLRVRNSAASVNAAKVVSDHHEAAVAALEGHASAQRPPSPPPPQGPGAGGQKVLMSDLRQARALGKKPKPPPYALHDVSEGPVLPKRVEQQLKLLPRPEA
ncbi:hypothetical protein DIPPA_35120 [Diplonema papillatum]|nr:hypothetical protein DIPPA_35120 [Diplonema papillatum]